MTFSYLKTQPKATIIRYMKVSGDLFVNLVTFGSASFPSRYFDNNFINVKL